MDPKPNACAKCFMACGQLGIVKEGRHEGLKIEGPEYETIYAFGGLCLIDSLEEIAYLNDICDRTGMDTITTGNLCGFAIEASRRGKIDDKIDYGDVDAIAKLLHKIARRKGIGEQMLGRIFEWFTSRHVDMIELSVSARNQVGYSFWRKHGFGDYIHRLYLNRK